MRRTQDFHFKQFSIAQDRCAMKVTTDACIFGAIIQVLPSCRRILDLGAGTGLLSLMMAQRTDTRTTIEAIEIDPEAATQGQLNFNHCQWNTRLSMAQADIRTLDTASLNQRKLNVSVDLVVSNPPFFHQSLGSLNPQRHQARHTDMLSPEALFGCIGQVVSSGAEIWILSASRTAHEYEKAANNLLSKHRLAQKIAIKSFSTSDPHCHILHWVPKTKHKDSILFNDDIVIYQQPKKYTEAFIRLLQPYYLKL